MKLSIHRKQQWDYRDGTETILCVHLSSANGSTRVFFVGWHPAAGYLVEFGGKHARERMADCLRELFPWTGRFE
jgi:hypothetical protein